METREILLMLLLVIPAITSYRILYLVPFPAPSHWFWLKHFSDEFLRRGHEVTVVTNYRRPESHANLTEIIIEPPCNINQKFTIDDFFGMKFDDTLSNLYLTWDVGLMTTEHAFNAPNVQTFLNQTDARFDVIVLEQFFHDSWLMFAHKFKAPIVTIATLGHADYFDSAMGLETPSAFVPHSVLALNDDMSFWERCQNLFWTTVDRVLRKYYYMARMQEMAEKYFIGLDEPLPSIIDIEKNITVRIVNHHRSTTRPRPMMPGVVHIAGPHIKPPEPLPNDIQEFLDSASDTGAIYFSIGSCIRSADMPKEKLHAFIEVFRGLKQKVLWKYEDESIPNLPANVMIRKWLPQNDVLAHTNIVLFIAHGGVFGKQEGIYHGVPMLFIPFYSDQFRNAKRAVDYGYALMLRFVHVTRETLSEKLEIILNDPKFRDNAKEASILFRDNPIAPMEETMYWIEYVARHNGAKVFESTARHMPWYIYFHFDIIAVVILSSYVLYIAAARICRALRTKFLSKQKQDRNNNELAKKKKVQ